MFTPESYEIIIALFPRLLGFIYFCAFGAFLFQIKGLLCSNGILPIATFLDTLRRRLSRRERAWLVPSVFWFYDSDRVIFGLVAVGTCLSVLLMLGFFPSVILLLLYILYVSLVSTGQDFLSFGWEGFLLEVTLNAFLLSLSWPPNPMVWISLNLVLFRFHLQAGAVKLQSGDPNWRNLTALSYHYQSQPIPNAIAWYIHKFPMWFHKFSVLFMFAVELVVPFGLFGNDLIRLWTFFAFFGLQWVIWLTGNFSFLNHLTVVLSTILVADVYLVPWLSVPLESPSWIGLDIFVWIAGSILVFLQVMQLWHHFFPNSVFRRVLNAVSSYHIANRYGIFAIMTTTRYEIIVEGSEDGVTWKEYTFRHKPSETNRRPRRISPYQPRIDWQAWFLPLGHYRYDPWFGDFIYHLLLGTPEVLKLLRDNPFRDKPPHYVRTLAYEYTFTSLKEKKATGRWWNREYRGIFTRPMQLSGAEK